MIKRRIGERTVLMTKFVGELADILKRETRSFSAISELLVLEEKCLISCDRNGLQEVIERQGDVLSSIACLEKSRIELIAKIGELAGENPETLTIQRLAAFVEDPLRRDLIETGHILSDLHHDVNRKKITNNMLIKQAMLMVENDIRLVLNTINTKTRQDAVYSPAPKPMRPAAGVCLDQRL